MANQQAGIADQSDTDSWRKGSTPNSGPIVLSQDPYYGSSLVNATFKSYDVDAGYGAPYENHFHNIRENMKSQQDAHLANQQAGIADQTDIDSWRKGSTPSSGPIVLSQDPYYGSSLTNATFKSYDVDGGNGEDYNDHFHNLRESLKSHQDSHLANQQK